MRELGFTPPDLAPDDTRLIERRHAFYVPGYDPEARHRYHALFARELGRYAARFEMRLHHVSPLVESADRRTQTWTVDAGLAGRRTATTFEILLWDDMVRRDMARPVLASLLLLLLSVGHSLGTGTLLHLFRLSRRFAGVIPLYPLVVSSILLAVGAGIGSGLTRLVGQPAGSWGAILVAVAAALGFVQLAMPVLDRFFLRQLANDWVFKWQHGNGWREDYTACLDAMAARVAARIDADGADEITLVGHSSGALAVVEVAARVIVLRPGARLSLLTLGAGLPLVALVPRAARVRADIAAVVACDRVVWAEYQAPQDWMNFPGFNPARDLGPPPARVANPLIRSARFREIVDPAVYRRVRRRPFRMHFQFLFANDRPGEFDVFALLLGPRSLRDRVLAPDIVPLREPAGSHP
ncbi:alpha/beta hydrolase [Methylobacterium oryzihabitans]|uniref:Alpha/beta hydrolase n=1 Tax=Methylobacterium oryzihabitans TaxID=2499852 RepID=A0A437P596_9HYPH|nr:alpha/beta hydrolase [Methylobacterium oryzihabitans]RVU17451.1 alpha/beta hydrolase [Methylobacterium oryzihabitans]